VKRGLIIGITAQDGAAEFLLSKGYEVRGIKRRASSFNTDRIDHLSLPGPAREWPAADAALWRSQRCELPDHSATSPIQSAPLASLAARGLAVIFITRR
jgi:hypothetical protein